MRNSDMPAMPGPSSADDGEPNYRTIPFEGLTKREYTAIKLYAGMLTAVNSEGEWTGLNCASEAVSQADLLLAELDK